ncbi:hypothetical protein A3B02_02685 [Candidatus Roizmanbacteria bacterium RIFCSPLOWO2_01_FULL_42_14]|uniref:Uncharacterized protein n=3 Tax=Candidatus Roizmaniibacteriota TaxID=1752723 RepID=A0A1F7JUF7_9BACT|nr:MAG: hypothetical protein A3D08_00970 [Candidatus Roizmanbacteria bacterium RIFCSPHIGHO2_02_FULL_43_11]OGK51480.1 MAG: hypothetical protein A3B02_02685 [Candidatus Roizmanbacteria bacterium RIFCSPLOWO2_01_FULL_42_14]OGK59234.1 MAG: hypothetical protein A3I56_03165 [Candidatus Roizmanbacteria bacterium RIFCSPLOWO2_02_FULL_43_10]
MPPESPIPVPARIVTTELAIGSEHIDQYGHVNYKAYPALFERGQDAYMALCGVNFDDIEQRFGLRSVVVSIALNYCNELCQGDQTSMVTVIARLGNSSFTFNQKLVHGEEHVADLEMVVVMVNKDGVPTRIPDELRKMLY